LTAGSNNIDIGNPGAARDTDLIKIGTPGTQTAAFIAGVTTARVTGAAVYVTPTGQLGVLASSERYKTDIESLNTRTEKLQQLRPVSFHLKSEPSGAVQYGLIAEEVEKIYPELVIRDDHGRIQGVRYEEITPILLKVVQQQQEKIAEVTAQAAEVAELKQQMADLKEVNARVLAALAQLQAHERN
jgi:hypothetical protein